MYTELLSKTAGLIGPDPALPMPTTFSQTRSITFLSLFIQ